MTRRSSGTIWDLTEPTAPSALGLIRGGGSSEGHQTSMGTGRGLARGCQPCFWPCRINKALLPWGEAKTEHRAGPCSAAQLLCFAKVVAGTSPLPLLCSEIRGWLGGSAALLTDGHLTPFVSQGSPRSALYLQSLCTGSCSSASHPGSESSPG